MIDNRKETSRPDCGRYLVVFEKDSSWVFELSRTGEVFIGRGDGADVRLEDAGVSRRHASIRIAARDVLIRDLGSQSGALRSRRFAAPRPRGRRRMRRPSRAGWAAWEEWGCRGSARGGETVVWEDLPVT